MSTDLYGNPLQPRPPVELSLTRKRQAALLYHFASLDYLKGLKAKADDFIIWLDTVMERRKPVDVVGLRDQGWKVNDTMANWGTYAWPQFKEMQQSLAKQIAQRSLEMYSRTGVGSYDLGADEISTLWMDPEQEREYNARRKELVDYSSNIDRVTTVASNRRYNEQIFDSLWKKFGDLFPRMPKFRVLADVEVETGRKPPRTGVYVPRDDAYGTLQFGWRGGGDGGLGEAQTLNDFGRQVAAAIGHEHLWTEDGRLTNLLKQPHYIDDFKKYRFIVRDPESINDPKIAAAYLSTKAFVAYPCKWYYVEKLEGVYEDKVEVPVVAPRERGRIEGGQPCPREGWWFTPALMNSRRYFKNGEIMPNFDGDYGSVIWQWDIDQDTSKT